MKTLLLVLAVAGLALAAAPTAEAHHIPEGCGTDYPCTPPPCDLKCLVTHFVTLPLCLVKGC